MTKAKTDKVRASRDGHEFHEAWAARKSLQLLTGTDALVGIAVEGFSPVEQTGLAAEAVEIADLVLYYGKEPRFEEADSVVVVQLKYSHSRRDTPFRAADAKPTLEKFAATLASHKTRFRPSIVNRKLWFEILTNRPVDPALVAAIDALATGKSPKGRARRQATQFATACGLSGKELERFAARVRITGLAGGLTQSKQSLARVLADWSAAPDALARARLGQLRDMVRDKAGLKGEGHNLITQIDVLAALELQDIADLLPCEAAFPEVGPIVPREQLEPTARRITALDKPLLIHAEGGVGKTVFLQSLAALLTGDHEIELFDCFGGGRYRAPEDARHLPKRGLVHIANRLACRGLCDPLLPPTTNEEDLVKAFRKRLEQAVATLQRGSPGKQLLLFLDAIDNAAEHARDRGETSFPLLVLESVARGGPIANVRLVVSCRTYRRDIARGDVPCEELELRPFTISEAARYLRARLPEATDTETLVAHSRSQGNARILEHLALGDRALLEPSEISRVLRLDDLLRARIGRALEVARLRGYSASAIKSFLAGLSVLPAPVPLLEYADAHDMDVSEAKSFAVDLAPLLEQTRHGVMFRDEPTETLVRTEYAADQSTLRALADNLSRKQSSSVYAAVALPALLQKLGDAKLLFDLAFDERFPAAISSDVGKRHIRYARLRAATLHAATHNDVDRLVRLLVELSTLAASSERGTDYVLSNPDLVIVSRDVDATRRLFESRTTWPGTRHARLTIANTLAGELNDAFRHAIKADDWTRHFYRQPEEVRREVGGPDAIDIAALSFCLVAKGRVRDAASLLDHWYPWYAFKVGKLVFSLLASAQQLGVVSPQQISRFISALSLRQGPLASAFALPELDQDTQHRLIRRLCTVCKKEGAAEVPPSYEQEAGHGLRDGLLKAAGVAISLNRRASARGILAAVRNARPRLWSLSNRFQTDEAFLFVVQIALRCASDRAYPTGFLLLPEELVEIGVSIPPEVEGRDYREALTRALGEAARAQHSRPGEKPQLSDALWRDAEGFVQHRLEDLLSLTRALAMVLAARRGRADGAFTVLLQTWQAIRRHADHHYSDGSGTHAFFDALGRECLFFAVSARSDLGAVAVSAFTSAISSDAATPAPALIRLVAALSGIPTVQDLAGHLARVACAAIEREDEVSHRSALFAQLARAILPASLDEATVYFRTGLEQMDAIGSGDFRFTNELLNFAGASRGPELEEAAFHTLLNICELNLSSADKFPWRAFANGLSQTSGCSALARLARWSDRDQASLDYTLLPYLTALVERDKMRPETAIGLLRIATPVEFHDGGTDQFARLLVERGCPNSKTLFREIIAQYWQNHPTVFMPHTLATFLGIAVAELGADSDEATYLRQAASLFVRLRAEEESTRNGPSALGRKSLEDESRKAAAQLTFAKVASKVDPTSDESMANALDAVDGLDYGYGLKRELLARSRHLVPYGGRSAYIRIVAGLQTLDVYSKLEELETCRREWSDSSASLNDVFRGIAVPLLRQHSRDLVEFEYLATSHLQKLAALSSLTIHDLARELVGVFAAADWDPGAAVWLALATVLCAEAHDDTATHALSRLLSSTAARLASGVTDGPWKPGLYPSRGEAEVAAGLVWFSLGAPAAAERWQAAHSVRRFAKLGQWSVIDALVKCIDSVDAHPFQAPDLPFAFLHARLWLLIALARISLDHPAEMAAHGERLKLIALDKRAPHVLMRHFAASAVLACAEAGKLAISGTDEEALRVLNASPFPREKPQQGAAGSFYRQRPDSMPEPENAFHLEYDFDKYDVTRLSEMFGQTRWSVQDDITSWVRQYDLRVRGMYDDAGRVTPHRYRYRNTDRYHKYGYHLGWHASFAVAAKYLSLHPIVEQPYYDDGDPWQEWLSRNLLTRSDGLWLADGVDRPPLEAQVNLLEPGDKRAAITGSDGKLLSLLAVGYPSPSAYVVAGSWQSNDGVSIHISSALAPQKLAKQLALTLSQEDPFQSWLPDAKDDQGATYNLGRDNRPFDPWVVWNGIESRLDGTDPLGVPYATKRLQFSQDIATEAAIRSPDSFDRIWRDARERVVARSDAWGRSSHEDEHEGTCGKRLVCTPAFLSDVLARHRAELVVLLLLRRRVASLGDRPTEYWHTMASVRIDGTLGCHLYHGVTNALHESKY